MKSDKEFYADIRETMHNIKSDFTPKQIRKKHNINSKWNSLLSTMIIHGHYCEESRDYDDTFCIAGSIILCQYHHFKMNPFRTVKTYEIMQKMRIPLDKKMRRDYNKLKRKKTSK